MEELFNKRLAWGLLVVIIPITLLYYGWISHAFRPDWLWNLLLLEFHLHFIGILFYIPIVLAIFIFRWYGKLTVWLISVLVTIPVVLYFRPYPAAILVNIVFLSIPLFIAAYITLELNWRKKERETLLEREKERKSFITQIFKAQEDERKRIARELHDDTIHSLLIIASNIRKVTGLKDTQRKMSMKTFGEEITGEILRVSDDLRRLTLDLRPGILDNTGLISALRWLFDHINQESRINIKMEINGEERKIPHEKEVIAFRIIQEAFNNIRKHSQATEIKVMIEFTATNVKISIIDNGKGFILPKKIDTLASEGKLGLIGIQERVSILNGTLHIESEPGHGSMIATEFSF